MEKSNTPITGDDDKLKAKLAARKEFRTKQKASPKQVKTPVNKKEYVKKLVMYNEAPWGVKVKWEGGGELPKELEGSWTSRAFAQRAMDSYMTSRDS